jgi:hypothetical protein
MKATHYDTLSPSISKEMELSDYGQAEDIASKLGDIAKARGEKNVEYWVVSTEIPSLIKKVDDDDIPF